MSKENSKNQAAKLATERIKIRRSAASDASSLISKIKMGDRSALGMAITLLESSKPQDKALADELLQSALPYSGNSIRIGITGVPGVGKSTFIETLGVKLIQNGKKLAVLAIDPSSQKSKGSILGDKTRMERLSANESAFIRPSPTSEALGGVARKTREAIILCEAAGYDIILIETVGVGQSEIAVKAMVDCFLLLMLAGAGDELQGIKRGIMEMADILAITKSDGENIKASNHAKSTYSGALHLFPPTDSGWIPEVMTCSAYDETGIDQIWASIEKFVNHLKIKGFFDAQRHEQDVNWFRETIQLNLLSDFYSSKAIKAAIPRFEEDIRSGKITPFLAAKEILTLFSP